MGKNHKTLPQGHIVAGTMPIQKINELLGTSFPDMEVRYYRGFIKHVQKHHPGIWESYGHLLPDILATPDYVGQNPKEPQSIELYKEMTPDLLLAVKIDPSGYYYCSSLYDLKNGKAKIEKRLNAGRIKPFV